MYATDSSPRVSLVNLRRILVREGGRQHKAWGEGSAGTPGKR